jgi:class 3 adenylate cyclase/tetratricopeptide (TPR) repeat protein
LSRAPEQSWSELPTPHDETAHKLFSWERGRGMLEQLETSANELLAPYLPGFLADWISNSPQQLVRQVDATVAFVDISGFTKLSERLAKRGKVGAEELADAINTCFARLLAVAYSYGGGLIKFGGDALLLLFTGQDHEERACLAAGGMRRALKEVGALNCSGTRVILRMSVGVHSGLFRFYLVGETHRELIVTGPAASQIVLMEGTAEAGEIVISPATAAHLPSRVVGETKGPGFLLAKDWIDLTAEQVPIATPVFLSDLAPYVPPSIRTNLLADLHEPEHRRVTIAFVHFDETDELIETSGSQVAAEELSVLLRDVQAAVARYEIGFLGSDIDRNGGKIILTAGAPVGSGNDEERMLLALRQIIEVERRIPIRIGVNSGYVFAGDIGTSYRRTYTVMGDAVNLAARVMAKAQPGQLLATDAVLNGSRTRFETTALEPFMVKGKAKPVQAYAVGAVSATKTVIAENRVPLIGRDEELSVLQRALDSARAGRGALVEIIAEPGMGKSRLIEELRTRASEDIILSLGCELYQSSTPYYPFQGFLRGLIGIPDRATDEQSAARLKEVVAALTPQLAPWLPLLAITFGIEGVPETDETRQLDERFRRPRLNDCVYQLLARLLRTPTLVTIEDVHWADEASADLLRHLAARVPEVPWLLCATRREVDTGFVAGKDVPVTSMRLRPLDAEAAAQLVAAVSEDSPFPPHQIAALAERSGGNPLFLRELLQAARSEGIETLPDSVEGLIVARIDRLAPSERNLLRRASVVGRRFAREYLTSVLDAVPSEDDPVWKNLSEFIVSENGIITFSHALIRDGAYEGLPFRLRRRLHAQVGDSIANACGDTPDEQAELLSLHFFHAQRFIEAWRFSLVAAERANAIYANVEASEFYGRALVSAQHVEDLTPLEVARVQEALADVLIRMGAFEKARDAYRSARRVVKNDPVADGRLLLKISRTQAWLNRYSQALGSLSRGLRALKGIDTREASGQRADLMARYAGFLYDGGRYAQAIKWCHKAIAEAQGSGRKAALATAYRDLDLAYVGLGRPQEATHSKKALELAEELGDLSSAAAVLNNLGMFAYLQGRWSEALDFLRRASETEKRTGDDVNVAFSTNNTGELLSDQGKFEQAKALFTEALRVWQAAGHRRMVSVAKTFLGRNAARAGHFDEALQLFAEARSGAEHVGAQADVAEIDAKVAECYVFQGEASSALELADRTLLQEGTAVWQPLLHRVRGYALMQLCDLPGAETALNESLRAARALNADYEVALTLRALTRLASLEGRPVESAFEESGSILERLGVVRVTEPPFVLEEV